VRSLPIAESIHGQLGDVSWPISMREERPHVQAGWVEFDRLTNANYVAPTAYTARIVRLNPNVVTRARHRRAGGGGGGGGGVGRGTAPRQAPHSVTRCWYVPLRDFCKG
jgi:hypothetical protein